MALRARFLMVGLVWIGSPTRPSVPPCSRPSRTLRAAEAVARRRAILDSLCARRRPKSTVGAEESLRRGRTKERRRNKKARKKALAFVAAIRERKDGADRTKGWDFPIPLPARCIGFGKRKCLFSRRPSLS